MRVLTFIHSFATGGVERTALRLVRQWRDQGIDAQLWVGRPSGTMREELAADLPCICPRQPPFPVGWMETLWMMLLLPQVVGLAAKRVSPSP